MKKKISLPALLAAVAIVGFLTLMMAVPSFAASQSAKKGVSFSLSGQYAVKALWAQNQAQVFSTSSQYASRNTFQTFLQRVRLNSTISYDELAHGMPLAELFVQLDLTNSYNGVTNGYGTNGWTALGGTPAPIGFNHDFNTFGLRQAYLRVITPIGAIMVGRMPVKFGLGIAVNTNADGLGDFLPLGNIGVFAGTLFGSEVSAYNNGNNVYNAGIHPPTGIGYTHMQVGTIPTIEVMTLRPINDISYSAWLTEAHLNQFGTSLHEVVTLAGGGTAYSPATTVTSLEPTANITFGGLSVKYSKAGTKLAGEFDYFRGRIIASSTAINNYPSNLVPYSNPIGSGTINAGYYVPVQPTGTNTYNDISSYDLYLTGSTMLPTSTPVSVGLKFGAGAPISAGHYNFTYYSQVQSTRTLFGNVIDSNWQAIQMNAPGNAFIYGPPLGTNLANKYGVMVYAKEFLASGNTLQESFVHAAWLKDSINGSPMFGGSNIGTEFDLNFTHHFTKTLMFQAWGGYVWTGRGVESASTPAPTYCGTAPTGPSCIIDITSPKGTYAAGYYSPTPRSFAKATHKDIIALGSAIVWNF